MLVFIMLMARRKMVLTICFNTSHVGIYLYHDCIHNDSYQFQYIPCWYLSQTIQVFGMMIKLRFNTSHVGIYLIEAMRRYSGQGFQYIPCWYLSHYESGYNCLEEAFQYIPCWYLSDNLYNELIELIQFQYIPCWYLSNEFKAFPFLPFLVYPCIIYHFPFFYQPFRNFFNFF